MFVSCVGNDGFCHSFKDYYQMAVVMANPWLHMARAWRWWWRIVFARMQVQPPVKDENLQSIASVAKCLAADVSQSHPYASTEAGPYST